MPSDTWVASGKPDIAPSKFDLALAWIRENRETFIGSLVILLAIIVFSVYFLIHYRGLRDTAWKTLFIAQQQAGGGNLAQAQQQLTAIETSYGSTSAAPYATLLKGDMLYAQGRFKEAAAEYSKLLNSKELAPFALYNAGKAKEAEGDLAGAQVRYSDFLLKTPEHFIAPEVHASLARVQELSGNAALAKTTYEKIVLLYPDTAWALQAKARLTPPAAAPAKK
ncbi:MAG: tetratricopeptide repeat protein [Elusimicrobia bacterium]|nr:tetratricopeptide repeat protein [Elusimicrobiota bacterium]